MSHYGPALPPPTTSAPKREEWMTDMLSTLTDAPSEKERKEKEKEENTAPVYDYSAPGLHIMSGGSGYHQPTAAAEESKRKLKEMKEAMKKRKSRNEDDSRKSSSSSKLAFKKPERHRQRSRSPKRRERSRSPKKRDSSRSPKRRDRSRSPKRRDRSRSPKRRDRSRSPKKRDRSCSPKRKERSRSPKDRDRSPKNRDRSKSLKTKDRSPSPPKPEEPAEPAKTVTDDDLNKLSARILKAELTGNTDKIAKLTAKMAELKKQQRAQPATKRREETVILTKTDAKGNVRPVFVNTDQDRSGKRKKKKDKLSVTHAKDGERDRYFPDDDSKELRDLVREEKTDSSLGQDHLFLKYASKLSKMSEQHDWTLDDMFVSNIAKTKDGSKDVDKLIAENQREHKRLESCTMCLEKCSRGAIVFIGQSLYVRVPPWKSLTSYHCQIVPTAHTIASVNGDEDFWRELAVVKSALVRKFSNLKLDTVFLEFASRLDQRKHIFIDCVPVPEEEGTMLPAYFKKAILDCDVEWSQNKKLVDTRKKNLRNCVPQGLPYFSVEFGLDGGFAHVIEEERLFKRYFGLEIIGGVLDADVTLWRNPEKESSEAVGYKKRTFEKLAIEFPESN
eukprot:sb/3463085/